LIRYFRINDPYRLIGLLILSLIICLPLFIDVPPVTVPELKGILLGEKMNEDFRMYTGIVDSASPLSAWFHELIDSLFGRSLLARHILAFALIFLQGAYIGIMFIIRKAFNENTYIPSFIYCLLFFFSWDTLALSSELIGSTFLLLAINSLFKEVEFRVQRDETVLNVGLFISIASLFSFAFIVYLFCVMVILVFFTRTTLRKFLLLTFGFLLPHFLMITIGYLNGSLGKMWEYYYLANLGFDRHVFVSTKTLFLLSVLPLTYFVVSLIMLQREARFSKYQSQLLQIIFLWMGFSFLYLFYCKDLRPQHLMVFIPGFAFLFTHFFLFIRRKKFIEMNAWILLIGIVSCAYLARYNKVDSIRYDNLVVPRNNTGLEGKKILVLEDDLSYFQLNRQATPYLNWRLSEDVFRNSDYYENVTEVYRSFKLDPPDLVIDRENLLKPFLERSPELQKQYRRKGDVYQKIR
jgi:hypothetical protein